MSTDSRTRVPVIGVLLVTAVFAAAAGVWLGTGFLEPARTSLQEQMRAATLLPTPKPLASFILTDQDGHPYTLEDLRGHWTFVAIGYTSCPDVCATTMAVFDAISRRIASDIGTRAEVKFLLISVDPERDSPQRLAQYVRYFNPNFLGATGAQEQLKALTTQLGALYEKVDTEDSAMSYLVDHSATIFLLDPKARLVAIFSAPQDPKALTLDYRAIVHRAGS